MIAELQHIPLAECFLCLDCNAVGNCGSACAACGSVQVFAVQKWLDRKPKWTEAVSELRLDIPAIPLGTNADNVADRHAKGRDARVSGDKNGARLHPERLLRGNSNPAASGGILHE